MEKVRRDECAEDQNRHRNEHNRDEQGLGIGSEYEPPSKDELIIPFPSLVDSLLRLPHVAAAAEDSGPVSAASSSGIDGEHDGIGTGTRKRWI